MFYAELFHLLISFEPRCFAWSTVPYKAQLVQQAFSFIRQFIFLFASSLGVDPYPYSTFVKLWDITVLWQRSQCVQNNQWGTESTSWENQLNSEERLTPCFSRNCFSFWYFSSHTSSRYGEQSHTKPSCFSKPSLSFGILFCLYWIRCLLTHLPNPLVSCCGTLQCCV